jgi:hypothetical protein
MVYPFCLKSNSRILKHTTWKSKRKSQKCSLHLTNSNTMPGGRKSTRKRFEHKWNLNTTKSLSNYYRQSKLVCNQWNQRTTKRSCRSTCCPKSATRTKLTPTCLQTNLPNQHPKPETNQRGKICSNHNNKQKISLVLMTCKSETQLGCEVSIPGTEMLLCPQVKLISSQDNSIDELSRKLSTLMFETRKSSIC